MDQYAGAGALERYRSAAPSSGAGEKEAQAETSCAVSQLFLHGELEMPFCLRLFVFFLLSVVLFSSTDFCVERRITQTQSQEPSVFFFTCSSVFGLVWCNSFRPVLSLTVQSSRAMATVVASFLQQTTQFFRVVLVRSHCNIFPLIAHKW